uniref:Uncharacterized protein n=1 Tax=Anguilla anguilla TaxID=7936 RepID=A0A0E9U0L5_ANGAN
MFCIVKLYQLFYMYCCAAPEILA